MKEVAEKLCTVRKSISDVLIEVNKELLKKYKDRCYQEHLQQLMVVSTLNEDVCLLEEAENEPSGMKLSHILTQSSYLYYLAKLCCSSDLPTGMPATNTLNSRPKQITIAAMFSNTSPPPQGPIQSVVNLPIHLLSPQLQTQLLPKKEKGGALFL